jgi:RHS repeat-associated protein
LQQEQSFYPFGLQMAAISSKALLKTTVPFKYNAGNELEEEGSLNYYNTFYRKYDAQLGRFTGIDIRAEESYGMSVYNYGANNPVLYNDPMGDKYKDHNGNTWHGPDPFAGTGLEGTNLNFANWWEEDMAGGGGGGGGGGSEGTGDWNNAQQNNIAFKFSLIVALLNNGATINSNGELGIWETSYVSYTNSFLIDFTKLVLNSGIYEYGDHTLDPSKLPQNNSKDIQFGPLCVFKTLEFIGKYFGSNLNEINYSTYWQLDLNHPEVYEKGFEGNINELQNLIGNFFVPETYSWNNIAVSINLGHPIFAYINTQNSWSHAVFVTGYNNNGSIVYYDPERGNYNFIPRSLIVYSYPVVGLKSR